MKLDSTLIRAQNLGLPEVASAALSGRAPVEPVDPVSETFVKAGRPVEQTLAAMETLNQALGLAQRDLRFKVDDDSGQVIVQVVEPSSGAVIRQIPSEDVVRMASWLEAGQPIQSLGLEQWS